MTTAELIDAHLAIIRRRNLYEREPELFRSYALTPPDPADIPTTKECRAIDGRAFDWKAISAREKGTRAKRIPSLLCQDCGQHPRVKNRRRCHRCAYAKRATPEYHAHRSQLRRKDAQKGRGRTAA